MYFLSLVSLASLVGLDSLVSLVRLDLLDLLALLVWLVLEVGIAHGLGLYSIIALFKQKYICLSLDSLCTVYAWFSKRLFT